MKRPYLLFKRGEYWYFRLADESSFHTTGKITRGEAEAYVVRLFEAISGSNPADDPTFRQYAAPYFVWGKCPHVRRVFEESGHMTERHVRIQRGRLENHIFIDHFADKRLSEITRADVYDLRSRLLKRCSPATTNKCIGVVKVILREAVIREELDRDPTEYVRNVKYKKRERAMFTVKELKLLFPESGCGPWEDPRDYTCFFLAAVTGARRGELMVLRWRHVYFQERYLDVREAWKGRQVIGETKSRKPRIVPLSRRIIEKLEGLREYSSHVGPDDFLFCYDDGKWNGKRIGETWWAGHFKKALQRAGIEPGDRWLTPHCFRHTINTIVRDSGHDPAKIRAVLGWMDEAIQDNYTHWEPEHLGRWAEIVDEIWE